jgi:hypothetical protein
MALHECDSNAILSMPLKTRTAGELTKASTELCSKLHANGCTPEPHMLDNKCSHQLKKAFKKHNVAFQLVPPHIHRASAPERAIQTWKNHFCSGLAEWDLLMPQADITLKLLRSSRRQPKLSACACLFRNFDFNETPLDPPGTRAAVHITPNQRTNMLPHGVDGWCVGPSEEHCHCATH